MMVTTVNESLLSLPRDAYAEIVGHDAQDKINHAYVYAFDGSEVNNPFEFTYDGKNFLKGKQELNGEEALKYSRMRYDDPNGDYVRQERQRKIIAGVAKQVLSIKGLTNYRSILRTMGENVKTDLSFSDMRSLMGDYRTAFGNIKSDQLKGESFMQNGISYQRIDPSELKRVQEELKAQLK